MRNDQIGGGFGPGPAVTAARIHSVGSRLIVPVLTVALCGCATVGPNFNTPEAPAASRYTATGETVDALARLTPDVRTAGPWWNALGSADLDRVMADALAGNQTIAAADAALEQARAQAQGAHGAQQPRLDAAANAERERINFQAFGFPNVPNPTLDLYSIGGTVSYDLDLFGGARRRAEAADAVMQATGWRADAAYLTLTGNVALQAVRIAGLRAEAAAVREILADDQRDINLVKAAEAVGGQARTATTSGRAQLAEDQALLPPIDRQLSAARHAMALLVGKSPAEWSAPDFDVAAFSPPGEIPVSLPSDLVRVRPDIRAAEAELHADTARIGVADANLYPDVRLTGSLTQGAVTPGALFGYNSTGWMIGPSVTAPLLNGGQLRADRRAAEAQARASLAQYRQTVLTAFVQIADVLTSLSHDNEQLAADTQAQATAQNALSDARDAYRLGGGPFLSIVVAQRRVDEARLRLVKAQSQRLADIVALFAATARDWRPAAAAKAAS